MNPRIDVLMDEFTAKRAELNTLDTLCANERRDLTDGERADYDGNVTRMEAISTELDTITTRQARFDAVAATTAAVHSPARTNPRSPVTITRALDAGEEIKARALHALGKDSEDYETLTRSLAHGVQTDGINPTTIEGDLIAFVDANRYAVNASRRLPLPDNKAPSFLRPRKSQFTTVDVQTNNGDLLSSQVAKVVGDTVTKKTFGGTVQLSEQEIDWTEPAMLQVTIQDLAEQYAIATDEELCDAIETASTASVQTVVSLTAASDVYIKALSAAAAIAYGTSKQLPDTLYVAVDRWAYLTALTDGDGRPLFPVAAGQQNVPGHGTGVSTFTGFNIMGLDVVVDPNFSANFQAVAVRNLVEFYEQNKGLLQINAPSTLEVLFAYRGYVATNVYTQGFGALEQS